MPKKDEIELPETVATLLEHAQAVLVDAGLSEEDAERIVDAFEEGVSEEFQD